MTVREWADYLADREFFPNPDQPVRLVLDSGVRVEPKGATVLQDGGDTVMELKASPKRKYMFSLKFEANPVIEAHTLEAAEKTACEMMQGAAVTKNIGGFARVLDDYVAQEPYFMYFLEEVKE